MMRTTWLACSLLMQLASFVHSRCDDPTPAFPLPDLDPTHDELRAVEEAVSSAIGNLVLDDEYNATSFSLEVTSSKKSLFSVHHTAKVQSKLFSGTEKVDGSSLYRIASMTKPFTVLAILQQHVAGNLYLDDAVKKYIPALSSPQNGSIPWHEITIRALASQISGIPRDLAQQDLASQPNIAIDFGLPPVSTDNLPQCDSIVNYTRRCTAEDLTDWVRTLRPLFAPNQKSTYSNMNYDLLSLVIENVTGTSYPEHVQKTVLDPLNMTVTTFDTPEESSMVIPAGIEYYWNFDIGVQKATGGLYSCTDDLSRFLRYALTHYNAITPALNWFQPTSWSNSMQSFYGMPWEIFRTNKYLPHSSRPITLITKGGGLPGYTSLIIMIPEYGFGVSILVAGEGKMLNHIRDTVVLAMVKYADSIVQAALKRRYVGRYIANKESGLNSSMILGYSRQHGLVLEKLISNATDALASFVEVLTDGKSSTNEFTFYVTPTLLYQDETHQKGERWRILVVPNSKSDDSSDTAPWNNFCMTNIDFLSYGGLPLNEIIFWGESSNEREEVRRAQLTGFRIVLDRSSSHVPMTEQYNDEL